MMIIAVAAALGVGVGVGVAVGVGWALPVRAHEVVERGPQLLARAHQHAILLLQHQLTTAQPRQHPFTFLRCPEVDFTIRR
eukprot:1813100-Rhodomonas_salina.6